MITKMHPFDPDCEVFCDNRSIIVLKDQKGRSEYCGLNQKNRKFVCLRVDGCVISSTKTQKCDYLLLGTGEETAIEDAHFVELKGKDIKTGILQLRTSVENTISLLQEYGVKSTYAKLVLRATPRILPAKEWKDLRELLRRYNGDAYRQNTPYQDHL